MSNTNVVASQRRKWCEYRRGPAGAAGALLECRSSRQVSWRMRRPRVRRHCMPRLPCWREPASPRRAGRRPPLSAPRPRRPRRLPPARRPHRRPWSRGRGCRRGPLPGATAARSGRDQVTGPDVLDQGGVLAVCVPLAVEAEPQEVPADMPAEFLDHLDQQGIVRLVVDLAAHRGDVARPRGRRAARPAAGHGPDRGGRPTCRRGVRPRPSAGTAHRVDTPVSRAPPAADRC
jgi:hypothetical protein